MTVSIKSRIKRLIERTLLAILPEKVSRTIGFLQRLMRKDVSYSQYGEDLILRSYFRKMGIKEGIYVDIGCFHPTCISNTHLLHKNGWRGYAVDVDSYKLKAFKLMRSNHCETILGAVVAQPVDATRSTEVYKFNRLFWSEMDTLDRATADKYRSELGVDYHVDQVPLIDVKTLFSGIGRVNFINIDVEGLDATILKNIDIDQLQPEAILFEDNDNWGGSEEIKSLLHAKGYERLFVSEGSVCYAKPVRPNVH